MSSGTPHYEEDFYAWTQEQAALLREGKWHELDCEHLIEEIEDLVRSARKELRSYLEGLALHLLKWRYQPDYQTRSWRDSNCGKPRSHPGTVSRRVRVSARSSQPCCSGVLILGALCLVARQTRLPLAAFPETCPWPGRAGP